MLLRPPLFVFPLLLRRPFGTVARQLQVGPESPKFIEVPRISLPRASPRPRMKGILPCPRNIFPPSKPTKGTPKAIAAATTPRSRQRHAPESREKAAFQQWQRTMAIRRRQNLREGLMALRSRKRRSESMRVARLAYRTVRRQDVLATAEARDVRLTLPSVLSTLRLGGSGLPDPDRAQRLQAMAERHQAIQRAKRDERQHYLHELYLNASNFILTEAELNRAIEAAFKESAYDVTSWAGWRRSSVRDLLNRAGRNNMQTPEDAGPVVLEVGGSLTGGRLPASRSYMATENL